MAGHLLQRQGAGFHAAAVHEDDAVPQGRLGNHADHPIWADHDLRRDRREDCCAKGTFPDVGAGGGRRGRAQRHLADHPLSPRRWYRRQPDRIRRGDPEKGATVEAGRGGHGQPVRSAQRHSIIGGEKYAEQKDYTIDNFNYQLGNIKALPYSITKVTPYTANNKKFPFIEKYAPTDEEIAILANRITYSSFTVEAISTIQNHINARPSNSTRFVQGTFIRIEGVNASNHEVEVLAQEFEKGVYI